MANGNVVSFERARRSRDTGPLVFLKDAKLRLIYANEAADTILARDPETDPVADHVRTRHNEAEQLVLRRRTPLRARLDAWPATRSSWLWFISARWPLIDRTSKLIGLAACMAPIRATGGINLDPHDARILAIALHLNQEDLAAELWASLRASDEKLWRCEALQRAMTLLGAGRSLRAAATESGFSGIGALSKASLALTGLAPSAYRSLLASSRPSAG